MTIAPTRERPTAAATPPHRRASPRSDSTGKGQWLTYVVLLVAVGITLMPFLWMILGSLKNQDEILRDPNGWLPHSPTLSNYLSWFSDFGIGTYFVNSVVVALFTVAGNLLFCSMVGYALAKLRFPGKRALFAVVMTTLMVPGVVTFIPLFVLVARMRMIDTYPGLILPFLVSPLGVFLMRQFIDSIPEPLLESARMDGAGEFRIFARIVLPLCGPPLATLGILTFLSSWNNFLWPLVVAQDQDSYTLPVALSLYSTSEHATEYGLLLAGSVILISPIVLAFVLLQRLFTQGVATTGIR
jgi:multiple sugar transport system permease protein